MAGVDVAGHGDVDEEDRAVFPQAQGLLHHLAVDEVAAGGGRGDDDVGFDEQAGQLVEFAGVAAEGVGDFLGAFEGAVGDEQFAHAGLAEMAGGELSHLAGADEDGGVVVEVGEDLAGEVDGDGADRDDAAADAGLGADALGDGKGAFDGAVERGAGEAGGAALVEGGLELAEDLGFADDEAVEAGGDAEEVGDGGFVEVGVEVALQYAEAGVADAGEHVGERGGGGFGAFEGGVEFDAVAGRDDEGFGRAGFARGLGGGSEAVFGDREVLSDLDRGRLVREPQHQELHHGAPAVYCATTSMVASRPAVVRIAARLPRHPAVRRACSTAP
jgi:hypothetical protein